MYLKKTHNVLDLFFGLVRKEKIINYENTLVKRKQDKETENKSTILHFFFKINFFMPTRKEKEQNRVSESA